MIAHISIPAENPRQVALVLSEIWQGKFFTFPPCPGGYLVFAGDNHQGTCIEIIPENIEMVPNEEEVGFKMASVHQYSATHAAIAVPISVEEIYAIANQQGWKVKKCDRGPGCFELVELWIENRFLLELLTPEMLTQYINFMTPENFENFALTIN